jgi:hypothetical protein
MPNAVNGRSDLYLAYWTSALQPTGIPSLEGREEGRVVSSMDHCAISFPPGERPRRHQGANDEHNERETETHRRPTALRSTMTQ